MLIRSATSRKATPVPVHADPLTLVLDGIRLRCMVPSAHQMTAPWGVRFGGVGTAEMRKKLKSMGLSPPPREPPPLRGAIVAILRGSCCLEVEAHSVKLPLAGGDVVLIARKAPIILRDDWRTPVRDALDLVRREDLEHRRGLRYGGGGVSTTFLSGAFHFEDEADHPLLHSLPPVIHVRSSASNAAPSLDATLRLLSSELESDAPGSQTIVNHLAHVLFVQAVRAYAASLSDESPANWFHAVFDPDLAPALGAMHFQPETPWTVSTLAEQAGISRSAFAARFTAAVGVPPLQYLTDCRMRKARSALRDTALGIKAIAARVGYGNESAFSSAFRRCVGISPGGYRRSTTEAVG